MAERVRIAELTDAQLAKVQELESDLGTWLVAVQPQYRLAELTERQLERLRAVERELGVILLAYKSS